MKRLLKSEQSGRSMIEAIGYISVMIMIGVSAAAAVNSGYYRYRLGRITQQITDLQKVVSQRWSAAADYSGVNWETLYGEKLVPADLLRSGSDKKSKGKHAFSGDITIASTESYQAYTITFDGLPPDACTELGVKLWVANNGSDLDSIQINGKQTWCWPASIGSNCDKSHKDLPVKISDLASVCGQNWKNKIVWTFY